jgi:dTDP-4-amino-4,6-dideoxygalactose transaminase
MIPRHSLPFGVGKILSSLVSPPPAMSSTDLEKAYADTLGVPAVILLPSVRAGIHMAIQATNGPNTTVVGPAYTCDVVYDALALGRACTRLIDLAPNSFLMSPEGITAATEPGCALVLSEVYGIPYDQEVLRDGYGKGPRVRILDMAMSIPAPERMQHLEARDVALFSFGWGKPMYAGWGGVACFRDTELAGRVREIRDRWSISESLGLGLRRSCLTLLRVAMNQRHLYGVSHERHLYRLYKTASSFRNQWGRTPTTRRPALQFAPGQETNELPPEWTRPTTELNRKLALHNLRTSGQNAELRCRQAEIYSKCLVESGIMCGPQSNALPQSHFPVRVSSSLRDKMCDYLRGCGIDTSTLFPFPIGLSRDCYPNAAEAADEVVTLPLGPTVGLHEVQMVSRRVKEGLRTLGF